MVKKKQELNTKMREIIRIIHKKGGAMSTHEISEETGISYVTVKKYIKELVKRGVIEEHGNSKKSKKA